MPASTITPGSGAAPATPITSARLETSPSFAPNTTGRRIVLTRVSCGARGSGSSRGWRNQNSPRRAGTGAAELRCTSIGPCSGGPSTAGVGPMAPAGSCRLDPFAPGALRHTSCHGLWRPWVRCATVPHGIERLFCSVPSLPEEPMLTAPPSSADEAIAALLASPDFAPLVAAHRELEPRPPRHAPWPSAVDPRLVDALRRRGVEALYTHQAAAYEAAAARRNFVVVTPTASGKTLCYNLPVLDAVAKRRGSPGALPVPHQGAGGRPAGRAARTGGGGGTRAQDPHLRRRHAGEHPQRRSRRRPGRDHQPGHAPRRDPSSSHQVVQALREPALRRDRRAAHLPRPVRQPRRERGAPAAAHLRALRRGPDLHLRQRHHRQPPRARRSGCSRRPSI